MEKRLYRSRSDRMIWGVCGGLAKYFDMDPTIVRMITVLSMFLGGLGIWAYIVLAIVVPLEDSKAAEPKDAIKENVEEMKETARELGREIQSTLHYNLISLKDYAIVSVRRVSLLKGGR